MVGWRPVGWVKETVYVASLLGRGWWREGKENSVGSVRRPVIVSINTITIATGRVLGDTWGRGGGGRKAYSAPYPVQQHPTTRPS